jgi:hypothetical protein
MHTIQPPQKGINYSKFQEDFFVYVVGLFFSVSDSYEYTMENLQTKKFEHKTLIQ